MPQLLWEGFYTKRYSKKSKLDGIFSVNFIFGFIIIKYLKHQILFN